MKGGHKVAILRDGGDPIPQYQNADGVTYGAAKGANGGVNMNIISPIPIGTVVIGKVGIDQTVGQNIVKDADVGNEATGVVIPTGGLGKVG